MGEIWKMSIRFGWKTPYLVVFLFCLQLNCHRITCMLMFLGCLLGLAIVWMYGLCFQIDSVCSYSENISQNRTLAICCFVFGIIGILTACMGICLMRKYGTVFGFADSFTGRQGFADYYGRHSRCSRSNGAGGSDVLNTLRQQNEILQQQLEFQRQHHHQYGPFIPPQENNCYTNMAFIPPDLPPYSPREVSVIGSTMSPFDPPPPYSVKQNTTEEAKDP